MTICLKYGKIKYVCKKLPQKNDLLRRYKEGGRYVIITGNTNGDHTGFNRIFASEQFRTSGDFKILFGVDTDTGLLFDVLLHIGTLAAICIVYYKDVLKMIVEGIGIIRDCFINLIRFIGNKTGKTDEPYLRIVNSSYRKLVVLIIVSTIPTGIIGVVGKDVVEMASEILLIPGICLILTAVLLLLQIIPEMEKNSPKSVTYTNAFGVGIAQGIATLPGLSRSGTTITACLLSGFNRNFAVKYSF